MYTPPLTFSVQMGPDQVKDEQTNDQRDNSTGMMVKYCVPAWMGAMAVD